MKFLLNIANKGLGLVQKSMTRAKFEALALLSSVMNVSYGFKNTYLIECYDADGNFKWSEAVTNLVVNEGLNDNLDKYFKGSAYNAAFFVGLTGTTPAFASGDTLAAHPGWTEFDNYTETERPDLILGAVSGQAIDNSASRATFTLDAGGGTIGGAFVATDDTKSGAAGTLYGGASFPADRTLLQGDQLLVTVILSAASL